MVWLIAGLTNHEIEEAVGHYFPGEEPEAIGLELAEQMREAGRSDPLLVRGFCVLAARDLYKQLRDVGDFQGALRAVKLLRDMAG